MIGQHFKINQDAIAIQLFYGCIGALNKNSAFIGVHEHVFYRLTRTTNKGDDLSATVFAHLHDFTGINGIVIMQAEGAVGLDIVDKEIRGEDID